MERWSISYFWLVKAKKTSLLVTIFVLCVALLASCGGSTDEGSNGSNNGSNEQESSSSDSEKEEASKTDSNDRGSNEQESSSSDSGDQSRGEGKASSEEVASASDSPNYPDPTRQTGFLPFDRERVPGYEFYHPDADGDGVGSGSVVEYKIGQQPPGWVITDFSFWDNCPETYNPNQEDSDADGLGDLCDPEPLVPYNPNQAK